ncbi:MAG: YdcF family protein [Lachnospiraceae bacterium]|nr:YdcF family protein [Lachnospiraceae bacterium]
MKKRKGLWKKVLAVLLCLAIVGTGVLFGINAYVKHVGGKRMLTAEEAAALDDVDCIMVLGCLVKSNGVPSDMLTDRLTRGVELYELGAAPKLLMTGDHGRTDYNEVQAMKDFATDRGIVSSDVFMDHAGFSTYDSVYRARDVFAADRIIIVSQGYHLYRALYIAEKLGVDAYGVAADYHTYRGQTYRDLREILARVKDAVITVFKPEPTYLGDVIPVSGDGDLTND